MLNQFITICQSSICTTPENISGSTYFYVLLPSQPSFGLFYFQVIQNAVQYFLQFPYNKLKKLSCFQFIFYSISNSVNKPLLFKPLSWSLVFHVSLVGFSQICDTVLRSSSVQKNPSAGESLKFLVQENRYQISFKMCNEMHKLKQMIQIQKTCGQIWTWF